MLKAISFKHIAIRRKGLVITKILVDIPYLQIRITFHGMCSKGHIQDHKKVT